MKRYKLQLDRLRILVFYHKIACLYFGSGDNQKAIEYFYKIILLKMRLPTDLQRCAGPLHLIAHYELGNYNLLEYSTKPFYRLVVKINNERTVENEVFQFIRKSFSLSLKKLIPAFVTLKEK